MKGFTRLRSTVRPGKRSSRSASAPLLRRASFEHLEERLALSAGALDPSFGIGGKVLTNVGTMPTNDYARDVVAYQSDGKMIVVGQADADVAVVRYKADGSLDTTFGMEGKVKIDLGSYEFGRGVAIDSADRIIIGGVSYQGTTGYDFLAIRLTSSGLRDTTFDGDGIQTIDFAGSHDIGWGVAVDSLDRVIVGGYAYIGGGYDFAVARLTATGALDSSFDGDGKQTIDFGGTSDFGFSVALDGSERVLVAGYSYQGGTGYDFAVARLTGTGALDTAFDGDGKQTVDFGSAGDYGQGVTADSSGRVLLVGYSSQGVTGDDFAVSRLTESGGLDTAFDSDGKQTVDFGGISDFGQAVAVDALDRVLVAGFSWQGTSWDIGVARLSDSGALDASFDFDGKVLTDVGRPLYDYGFDVVAYDADGKAVMVGSAYGHMAVVRYNPDGSLDTTFGTNGKVRIDIGSYDEARSVAIDSAGRIVVAGYSSLSSVVFAVARLTPSGTLDTTFNGDGKQTINFTNQWDYGWSVAIDSLDRVLVAGYGYSNGAYDFSVARLTVTGALDTTFDGDGKQTIDFGADTDVGLSVAVDASDRVVVAGYSYRAGANDFAVARLTVDGALDNTFDSDSRQTVDFGSPADIGRSVAVDSQGRILLAGYSYQTVGNDFAVARLTDGGGLDTAFDGDGKQTIDFGSSGDIGVSVALDSLDRVLVGGYSYQGVKRDYDFAVARLEAAGVLDTSFDDDGRQTIDFGGTRDFGYSAAVDAFGRVLVAGYSEQPTTGADFALARLGAALPPQAEAGGPYSVLEGSTVQLDASATTDPDQSNATLMYAWDFDGDAIYGETGTAYGDETGMQPVFSAAGLDGPTTVTVSLRVTDQTGLSSTDTATVNVSNVAPHHVTVAGPTSGVPGQTRSFQSSFSDPGVADTHTYQWNVTRDNAPYALPAGTITTASHFSFTPDRTGSYRVEVAITDDDGGVGQGHRNLAVVAVEVQDETCGTGKVLAVGGTTGDDTIVFAPGAAAGEVSVSINGVLQGVFASITRLLAFGQAGDDDLQVAGSIALPAWLFGGDGNDRLKGGAGHDVLLGGLGDDLLVGGSGRDFRLFRF